MAKYRDYKERSDMADEDSMMGPIMMIMMIMIIQSMFGTGGGGGNNVLTAHTDMATNVTETSATLNAEVTMLGPEGSVEVSFEYGTTTAYGNPTQSTTITKAGKLTAPLTELVGGTTYHYRLKMIAGGLTSYTADASFTTLAGALPQGRTDNATDMSPTTSTLHGTLVSMGSYARVSAYFEYGPTTSYGTHTPSVDYTTPQAISVPITGLIANTLYHFRLILVIASTVIRGDDKIFTTPTNAVAVVYSAPSISLATAPAAPSWYTINFSCHVSNPNPAGTSRTITLTLTVSGGSSGTYQEQFTLGGGAAFDYVFNNDRGGGSYKILGGHPANVAGRLTDDAGGASAQVTANGA